MSKKSYIKDMGERLKALPLVDVAVAEALSLLDNPASNFDRIAEKLSPDIAAKFLEMANSAYYGREVRSIAYAVKVLGYGRMKKILDSAARKDYFVKRIDIEGFNFEKFQVQAHFCAAVSKVLGEILGYERPEDLFTVAILQNIGKLILAVYYRDEFKEINAVKMMEGISAREAEQRLIGISHGQIGALVLEKFRIPQDIYEAIRFHDLQERAVPEGAGFQLEFIARRSSRVVAGFALPEKMEAQDIIDRLRGTVSEGRKKYLEDTRTAMQKKGYREIFNALLEDAADLVCRDLRVFLTERTPE